MAIDEPDILSILASMEDDEPTETTENETSDDKGVEESSSPKSSVQRNKEAFPDVDPEDIKILGDPSNLSSAEDCTRMETELRNGRKDVCCGTCKQDVKVYSRPPSVSMVHSLYRLVYLYERKPGWYHADLWNKTRGGDYAKLAHFGLVERCLDNDDPDTTSSGKWRPTQLGIDVAHRRAQIRKYVVILLNDKKGFEGDWVYLDEITKKFSIQEIWWEAEKAPKKIK